MKARLTPLGYARCMALLAAVHLLAPGTVAAQQESTWKEPLTGMEFVWIGPGCFQMGSPPEEPERELDEGPIHEVCVGGFWLGKTEVTVGQFETFAAKTGYRTEAEREGFSWIYDGVWRKEPGISWRNAGFVQDANHPVVNVSYNDAKAMAEWLQEENGRTFRLPGEAEWEYACRAGTPTARFWGDDPEEACQFANIADLDAREKFPAWDVHPCHDGFTFSAPAGRYKPNGFGLYDMLGNVWEWCEDAYDPAAYRRSGTDNARRDDGERGRVIRGASWYGRPGQDRCANRDHVNAASRRGNDLGFRLAIIP